MKNRQNIKYVKGGQKFTNYYKRGQLGTELCWFYITGNTLLVRFKKNFVVLSRLRRLAFILISKEVGPWTTKVYLSIGTLKK
jgi:hypothetical protein